MLTDRIIGRVGADLLATQVRHLPAKINPTLAAEAQSQQALGHSPALIFKNACSDKFSGTG